MNKCYGASLEDAFPGKISPVTQISKCIDGITFSLKFEVPRSDCQNWAKGPISLDLTFAAGNDLSGGLHVSAEVFKEFMNSKNLIIEK
jgi:hypothetical protein